MNDDSIAFIEPQTSANVNLIFDVTFDVTFRYADVTFHDAVFGSINKSLRLTECEAVFCTRLRKDSQVFTQLGNSVNIGHLQYGTCVHSVVLSRYRYCISDPEFDSNTVLKDAVKTGDLYFEKEFSGVDQDNLPIVQWYPGHIAKSERKLKEELKVSFPEYSIDFF